MRKLGPLAAAAILALAGCGLDSWPYLDPPGDPTPASPATPIFQIINQATLIPEFRGFEAYYKFYSSDQPRQENYTTREELENPSAGFHRIHSLGKTTTQVKPLISVDVADRNTVFMTLLNFYYLVQTPYGEYQGISPRPIDVRRSATDTLGDTMSFDRADLDPADADLTGVNWTQVGIDQQLFLVVYAISYGLKDYSTPLYSTAKYLGYMSYTID